MRRWWTLCGRMWRRCLSEIRNSRNWMTERVITINYFFFVLNFYFAKSLKIDVNIAENSAVCASFFYSRPSSVCVFSNHSALTTLKRRLFMLLVFYSISILVLTYGNNKICDSIRLTIMYVARLKISYAWL